MGAGRTYADPRDRFLANVYREWAQRAKESEGLIKKMA